ncbi:hypothetical protein GQ600_27826 [Phytophthora cactorum]|nr:hypothetical protein GQ600_27826 [Phytophthora cactorum]
MSTHHNCHSEERNIPKDALNRLAEEFGMKTHKIDDIAYLTKFFKKNPTLYDGYQTAFNKLQREHRSRGARSVTRENHGRK